MNWVDLHTTWINIQRRCYDPSHNRHRYYQELSVGVCKEWRDSYEAFSLYVLNNLGPRPPNTSIDRIHNTGNYEPGNIRWATNSEQSRNKRLAYGKSEDDHHIYYVKNRNKYVVSVFKKYVGSCKNLLEARIMRDKYLETHNV